MRKTFVIVLLIFSSISFAKEICPKIFPPENHATAVDEFLKSLNLEESNIWYNYLKHPSALNSVNGYLEKFVSPWQKNLTVFRSSPQVSDTTLIRVAQWRDLFRRAPYLPQQTTLYHQKWITAEAAAQLLKTKTVDTSEYLPSTPDALKVSEVMTDHTKEWKVLFIMEIDSSIRAVPGRTELQEYILDRGLKLTVLQAQNIPGMNTVILHVKIEELGRL